MSIKDDVKYVKKELSGDEKVLESAFKIEELYKKYKYIIWGVVVAILIFFISQAIMDSMKQSKLEDANSAFLVLQEKPNDKSALETLKKNNLSLFELYTFSKASSSKDITLLASLENSKENVISDSSKYTVGAIKKEAVNSELYKELALFEEAYLAIKSGDTKSAKEKLELIDDRSSLQMLTQLLMHSTIKVK